MAMGSWACRLICLLWLALAIGQTDAAEVKCQTKDGLTVFQVLERTPNVTVFTSLVRQGGLIPIFNNKRTQLTLFVPLDYAFGNILPLGKGFFDIFPGVEIPKVIVNYHSAVPATPPRKLEDELELTAGLRDPEGNAMVLNITENSLDPLKPFVVGGATNTANITRAIGKQPGLIACNSVIYLVDGVLLPHEKIIPSESPKVTARGAERIALSFEPLVSPRTGPRKPGLKVPTDDEAAEDEEAEDEEAEDEEPPTTLTTPPTTAATPAPVPKPSPGTGK